MLDSSPPAGAGWSRHRHTGSTACNIVMSTGLMTAVTVSEKPASFALPVSESVNLVENIVIGANDPSTMIPRIRSSNGNRNHAAIAMITLNVSLHPITFASSTRSLRLSGTSNHQTDHRHRAERVRVGERRDQRDDRLRNHDVQEHEHQHQHVDAERDGTEKREECCAPACRAAATIALPISNMMNSGIVHAQNPNSTIHSICMSCLLVANERMIAHGSVRLNTSPCATR